MDGNVAPVTIDGVRLKRRRFVMIWSSAGDCKPRILPNLKTMAKIGCYVLNRMARLSLRASARVG
jgi:hypothetical protein